MAQGAEQSAYAKVKAGFVGLTIMKKLLITTAVAVLLAIGTVLAVYFGIKYLSYEMNIYEKVFSYFILTLWAFSAVPAFVYFCEWLDTKTFGQAVWLGYVIGFVLPILAAPVLTVIYYVSTIEKIIKKEI